MEWRSKCTDWEPIDRLENKIYWKPNVFGIYEIEYTAYRQPFVLETQTNGNHMDWTDTESNVFGIDNRVSWKPNALGIQFIDSPMCLTPHALDIHYLGHAM